jgi:hypothetical protein
MSLSVPLSFTYKEGTLHMLWFVSCDQPLTAIRLNPHLSVIVPGDVRGTNFMNMKPIHAAARRQTSRCGKATRA